MGRFISYFIFLEFLWHLVGGYPKDIHKFVEENAHLCSLENTKIKFLTDREAKVEFCELKCANDPLNPMKVCARNLESSEIFCHTDLPTPAALIFGSTSTNLPFNEEEAASAMIQLSPNSILTSDDKKEPSRPLTLSESTFEAAQNAINPGSGFVPSTMIVEELTTLVPSLSTIEPEIYGPKANKNSSYPQILAIDESKTPQVPPKLVYPPSATSSNVIEDITKPEIYASTINSPFETRLYGYEDRSASKTDAHPVNTATSVPIVIEIPTETSYPLPPSSEDIQTSSSGYSYSNPSIQEPEILEGSKTENGISDSSKAIMIFSGKQGGYSTTLTSLEAKNQAETYATAPLEAYPTLAHPEGSLSYPIRPIENQIVESSTTSKGYDGYSMLATTQNSTDAYQNGPTTTTREPAIIALTPEASQASLIPAKEPDAYQNSYTSHIVTYEATPMPPVPLKTYAPTVHHSDYSSSTPKPLIHPPGTFEEPKEPPVPPPGPPELLVTPTYAQSTTEPSYEDETEAQNLEKSHKEHSDRPFEAYQRPQDVGEHPIASNSYVEASTTPLEAYQRAQNSSNSYETPKNSTMIASIVFPPVGYVVYPSRPLENHVKFQEKPKLRLITSGSEEIYGSTTAPTTTQGNGAYPTLGQGLYPSLENRQEVSKNTSETEKFENRPHPYGYKIPPVKISIETLPYASYNSPYAYSRLLNGQKSGSYRQNPPLDESITPVPAQELQYSPKNLNIGFWINPIFDELPFLARTKRSEVYRTNEKVVDLETTSSKSGESLEGERRRVVVSGETDGKAVSYKTSVENPETLKEDYEESLYDRYGYPRLVANQKVSQDDEKYPDTSMDLKNRPVPSSYLERTPKNRHDLKEHSKSRQNSEEYPSYSFPSYQNFPFLPYKPVYGYPETSTAYERPSWTSTWPTRLSRPRNPFVRRKAAKGEKTKVVEVREESKKQDCMDINPMCPLVVYSDGCSEEIGRMCKKRCGLCKEHDREFS